jgi:hypothetical protein
MNARWAEVDGVARDHAHVVRIIVRVQGDEGRVVGSLHGGGGMLDGSAANGALRLRRQAFLALDTGGAVFFPWAVAGLPAVPSERIDGAA